MVKEDNRENKARVAKQDAIFRIVEELYEL